LTETVASALPDAPADTLCGVVLALPEPDPASPARALGPPGCGAGLAVVAGFSLVVGDRKSVV
jgi:hypothetical protein